MGNGPEQHEPIQNDLADGPVVLHVYAIYSTVFLEMQELATSVYLRGKDEGWEKAFDFSYTFSSIF